MKNKKSRSAAAVSKPAPAPAARSTVLTPTPPPAPPGSSGLLPPDLRTWPGSPMRWRWKYIESLSGSRVQHVQYFCSLDEATDKGCLLAHPALPAGQGAARLRQMGQLAGVLQKRIQARADGQLGGPLFDPHSPELTKLHAAVVQWSRIQLDLLFHYYGDGQGGFRVEEVEMAYLMFAAGELRVPLSNRRGIGEADSAYYFAWAEFALLAGELGIDAASWDALLRTLVWTQGVYTHMQRPIGARPHGFHQYGPRGRERVFTLAVAADAHAKVRNVHTRTQLAVVHTTNCKEAFA